MAIDSSFRVYKLPPSHITELAFILDFSEQWKKLLAVIPKRLSKDTYECCISSENPPKYNSDDIRIIETAAIEYRRSATASLLDEWGCSGRVCPTIGHLLHLLLSAQLYRAADYVSEKILNREAIKRPSQGPAAAVPFNRDIEDDLKNMKYSSSMLENLNVTSLNNNLNRDNEICIPPIVITPDADQLIENPLSVSNNADVSLPNLIEFSGDQGSEITTVNESVADVPLISSLLEESTTDINQSITMKTENLSGIGMIPTIIPDFTNSDSTIENSTLSNNSLNGLLPNLSSLHQSEMNINLPNLTDLQNSEGAEKNDDDFLPQLSALNVCQSDGTSDSASAFLPDIGGLMAKSKTSIEIECAEVKHINSSYSSNMNSSNSSTINEHSTSNSNEGAADPNKLSVNTFDSSKSRKCNSPLPNLTLTTHLPHYTYEKLKASTNDFNEESFTGLNKEGRLLGSGAFGKVFLATGISQEPVAVKKIILGNVEVVDVDDRVTKQFTNEVEVLSKFRHKNLISLLGFSCDGCTYCLLYEYIPGGTLKDRLQSEDLKLSWQERLSIALGTANAISYLHTAFSSPLIHRDVKTANILLDQTNKPKLGDFGITTLLDNKAMNTCTVIGTSAYMAPEAMRGDISVKCDTFSFGVVLLELLTSLPPFDESRDGHDLVTHVEEKCEDSIAPLLDKSIGTWSYNGVNFGEEIYSLAVQCIEEKKRRPVMVDVTEMLMITVSKL